MYIEHITHQIIPRRTEKGFGLQDSLIQCKLIYIQNYLEYELL